MQKLMGWLLSAIVVVVFIGVFFWWTQIGNRMRQQPEDYKPTLTVYTHSSFASSFGPGPELAKLFEAECDCSVKLVNAGDAGLLIQRLKMSNNLADVVIGLDQLSLKEADKQIQWRELEPRGVNWVPEVKEFRKPRFLPYDWAAMTLLYREGEVNPPHSLSDLMDERYKDTLVLQDPRSSSPGLQFLFWVFNAFDSQHSKTVDFFRRLKPNVLTVSPSWSAAYGLFKAGQAKMVFSYVTSLAYHQIEESDQQYRAANFEQGHPYQVEYAGIPQDCRHCKLAGSFLQFLLSPKVQAVLMKKNFMMPVVLGVTDNTPFSQLPKLAPLNASAMEEFLSQKQKIVTDWVNIFRD